MNEQPPQEIQEETRQEQAQERPVESEESESDVYEMPEEHMNTTPEEALRELEEAEKKKNE